MEMQGEQRIAAARPLVWTALNDPEILKQCIPGCQSLTKVGEDGFTAEVLAKVGPVSAKFKGKVTLSDLDPPNGYTIAGEGQGGVAGFGKGDAKVALVDDGDGTLLRYNVTAQVGGKLAQIGSRLIDSAAAKMAEDFFTKFNTVVAAMQPAPAASQTETSSVPPPATSAIAPTAAPTAKGLHPVIWIGGTIVVVAAVLALLLR